jgi:GT2 family glycosyltransferase
MIKIVGKVPHSVKLVIITVYYNVVKRKEFIERSLTSLCSLEIPPHLIVLVDNGSQDGTWHLLETLATLRCEGKNVVLIKLPRNLGFSRANNIAYNIVTKLTKKIDYIVLLNDDVIINGNFLKLLDILERLPDKVCGIQGLLLSGSKGEWSIIDSSANYIAPFVSLV